MKPIPYALFLCLAASASHAATIAVELDTTRNRRPIDPQIYGANFAEPSQFTDPGFTVQRIGGNATTRYNWQVDVSNRGSDYVYLNVAEGNGSGLPNASSTNVLLQQALDAGVEPILTVGTIGWTPVADRAKRYGFAVSKYGPQLETGDMVYDPDGGNGECNVAENQVGFCTDTPGNGPHLIVGNDPTDTSFVTGPQWTRDWIAHLKSRHGTATSGGVRYYALDNEAMLWNSTHRDVHPQPATYDEIWQKTVDYATAIKAEDPGAKIFGPVTWGYCDLFGSAADNCLDGADRAAHGGLPFVQWFLRQMCSYQQTNGIRLIDYLDLHYYPQGENVVDFGGNLGTSESVAASARRLRSLKELYDTTWVSESWMADLGDTNQYHYDKPQLIPRVRAWIAAECPGTKLALTEYNWGPDRGVSGALAQAEAMAIFGREGVDLAARWVAPPVGSLVERAFELFLDYDGAGARVEGDSVFASSSNVDAMGAYGVDRPGERSMLLLFNKDTVVNTAQIALAQPRVGTWRLYRIDMVEANPDGVVEIASGSVNGSSMTLPNLAARSANLLVLPAVGATGNELFRNGFEGG